MSQPGPNIATSRTESADDGGPFGRQLVAATPRILAFVRTLCRGGVVGVGVEDLVQETLARAWRSRATFDASKGTAETWLSRIAFCVYLDHREAGAGAAPLREPLRDEHAVAAPGPLAHAAARERTRHLFARLGARERDVLLRFHRDGRSIAELAAAEAVSPGTIKSLLHRARARLWAAFLRGEQP